VSVAKGYARWARVAKMWERQKTKA